MGRVEQAQLHVLIGLDVFDQIRAHQFPSRTSGGKVVFDHPLAERLCHHATFVQNRDCVCDTQPVGRRDCGHDAIHHRGRECHIGFDPGSKLLIQGAGEFHHHLAAGFTVGGQVVTTHHRKRLGPIGPTLAQSFYDKAQGGARPLGISKIKAHICMIHQKPPCCRIA